MQILRSAPDDRKLRHYPRSNRRAIFGEMQDTDLSYMRHALEQARGAAKQGEVPVGAVVVLGEEIIGAGFNRTIADHDPTAHAEAVALRQAAARIGNYRLTGATLYVTVEPCAMCAGAALLARIGRLVYGCDDPKAGAVRSLFRLADDDRLNHRIPVTSGVLSEESSALLRDFFRNRRAG